MGHRSVSSSRRRANGRWRPRERGFTLVALVVVLIVLNIAVAAAMQLWSKVALREKEEELIFRGLQYAEAIRVFQARYSRPPISLEELLEVRPRCIRQLWEEPLSETGAWEPILAGSGSDVAPVAGGEAPSGSGDDLSRERDTGNRSSARQRESSSFASSAAETQIAPIEGVRPTATGTASKVFLGWTEYQSWEFRAQMLAAPRVSPEGIPLTPRIDPDGLSRPFPSGLSAIPGSPPPESGEENPLDESRSSERGGE